MDKLWYQSKKFLAFLFGLIGLLLLVVLTKLTATDNAVVGVVATNIVAITSVYIGGVAWHDKSVRTKE